MKHENWGGVREGAGRPATGKNTKCMTLTLTIEQADELKALANNEGLTVSQYVAKKCGLKGTKASGKAEGSYQIFSAADFKMVAENKSEGYHKD